MRAVLEERRRTAAVRVDILEAELVRLRTDLPDVPIARAFDVDELAGSLFFGPCQASWGYAETSGSLFSS